MFKNYLKTAFRNLWKNKTSSIINVLGLTIGLGGCLLIALYIQHELSYDGFEANGNRISRMIMEYKFDGGGELQKGNYTSTKVAPVFKRTFPEVVSSVRMVRYERVVAYGAKLLKEPRFMYADSSFFDIFSFKMLQGDPHTALNGLNKVVVTASTAEKYFGTENPVGKILIVGTDSSIYQVTGVIQDCPSNSQIKYDFLASFSTLGENQEDHYWDANFTTYLLLKDEKSRATLQAKITPFMKKEMQGQGATIDYYLEPFNSIHLHSEFGGFEPNNNITYIYILSAVALLILIIACFTYINLSTARAMERAKEVGVRKVIGAGKKQLFWQFIGESAMLCLASVVLSMIVAIILLPWFNQLTEKQLQVQALLSFPFIASSLGVVALVSLLAGSYPALILAGFQPVKVLKGAFKNTSSGQWLRKSLIVFQFVISVFLIVSTFIIQKQLYYIQHKELGYDREHIVVLPMDSKMLNNINLVKQQLKTVPGVINVSRCMRSPVEGGGGYNMRSTTMAENAQLAVIANPVDEDFVKTTGIQILAGSEFTQQDIKDVATDDQNKRLYHFILNESAAKQLGWKPGEAVGKRMFLDNSRPGIVRGVVRDFNFQSLHDPIKPIVLFTEMRGRELLVKIKGDNLPQTITALGAKWKTLVPYMPFEYRFMDDDYDKLYNSDMRLGKVMNIFASIAIVLACLGLFGLSSYSAQQRVKEIGIRKILGAKLFNIAALLSKDFIMLVSLAFAIAIPISWWAMSKWLQNYEYRITVTLGIFFITGIVTLFITLLTVSFQAIKTALANPVEALKTE